jgi:CheY-like chemotaxis protein
VGPVNPFTGPSTSSILMVDDRPENLLALEAILAGLGHELIRAGSGAEALKCLLTKEVALILLDVQMPGMDGYETAAQIKARDRTRHIPIVFLTAIDGEPNQAFRGYAAGAVDYLCKPFDPWVLRAKVSVFIELGERRRELADYADQVKAARAIFENPELPALRRAALETARHAEALAESASSPAEVKQATKAARHALEQLLDLLPSGRLLG